MNLPYRLVVVIFFVNSLESRSRTKRYVAFPDGSTFIFGFCMTLQTIIPNNEIFTEGVNWSIAYDLPNRTTVSDVFQTYNRYKYHRIQRRDVYNRLEIIMDSMGFSGRTCILKALCEISQTIPHPKDTLSERIVQLIFRFPHENWAPDEPMDHYHYHQAYQVGRNNSTIDCGEVFPECSISLIGLALGYYHL